MHAFGIEIVAAKSISAGSAAQREHRHSGAQIVGTSWMADACNHISHVWAVGLLSQSTLVTNMHSSKLLLSTQRINVTLVDGELISVLLPTIVGGAVEK